MYLGKEYTEEQINKMDCYDVNTLLNRYKSVLSAQMTKSLGKSIINLYSNNNNNKKRSHTQLDSRKQVIAFQDRVITINIKEAQHPLKREKQT